MPKHLALVTTTLLVAGLLLTACRDGTPVDPAASPAARAEAAGTLPVTLDQESTLQIRPPAGVPAFFAFEDGKCAALREENPRVRGGFVWEGRGVLERGAGRAGQPYTVRGSHCSLSRTETEPPEARRLELVLTFESGDDLRLAGSFEGRFVVREDGNVRGEFAALDLEVRGGTGPWQGASGDVEEVLEPSFLAGPGAVLRGPQTFAGEVDLGRGSAPEE